MKTKNTKEKIKKLSVKKKDLSTKLKVIGGQIKGLRQTLKQNENIQNFITE